MKTLHTTGRCYQLHDCEQHVGSDGHPHNNLTYHDRRIKAACVFTVFISIPCHHDDEVEATEVTVRSQTKKMLARVRVLYEDNVCNNTSATRRSVGDWFCKTGKTCVIEACCASMVGVGPLFGGI